MKNNDLLSTRSGLSKIKQILIVILVVFMPLTIIKAGNTRNLMEISQQQKKQISGIIRDVNNEPIIGANIIEKNVPANGTVTDVDGKFTLSVKENAIILVSYIGYLPQEISVAGKSYFETILQEDTKTLDEVVVVGYGTQSREMITTSITKLDNKALENVPYSTAASALQGTISGVRVQSISGQPGTAPRVIVRGGTSINDPNGASPLYIIDGIIRPHMNDISTNDIESIQVLKDAASTSIYGARGSNGVVIITTKSGRSGKMKTTYAYNFTVSSIGKRYEMANARDFITTLRLGMIEGKKFPDNTKRLNMPIGYGTGNDLTNRTAFTLQYLNEENKHKLNEGWESMPDPVDPSKTLIFQDTNIQDLVFRTGYSHNHHVEMSGGTEKTKFLVGLGYMTNDGTVVNTNYNRLSFNLNGSVKLLDNLDVTGRTIYSNSKTNRSPLSDAITFYRNVGMPPTTKIRFEDGTIAPGANLSMSNPLYSMYLHKRGNNSENLTLSLDANWQILPGLTFKPQLSLFRVNNNSYSFTPAYWDGPLNYNTSRSSSASNYQWTQYQADAVFDYNKVIQENHNFYFTAGFTYYDREENRLSASGKGASTDLIPTLNASAEPTSVSSLITNHRMIGYFGRINYNYLNKYLLSFNTRYDGASNLGQNNKWGFFPGISLGWHLDKENFWATLPENLLKIKLRASYGVNGNISGLGDFTADGNYSVGTKYYGNAAIILSTLANQDLKWERSKTFDIGADIKLFNEKITVIADVFRRVTDNLITNFTLPPSTGFNSILTNLGSLENKGLELEVSADLLRFAENGFWNVSFNASKVKNKILSLPPNGTENNRIGGYYIWDPDKKDYGWFGGLQEGGAIGELYAYKQIGVYATDEEAASAPHDMIVTIADKTKYGGDTNWLDSDGNNIIDSRDRVYMGNIYPTWTGGFSSNLTYKGLNFYTRLDYTVGHTIFNWAKSFIDYNLQGDNNITQDIVERSWKKQGDIAEMPRMYWAGERVQSNTFRGSSLYHESGNFLCIREVSLSYSFLPDFFKKIKIENFRVSLTGNNLHYFTKYKGLNPEDGGRDDGRYAVPKNVILSTNITF